MATTLHPGAQAPDASSHAPGHRRVFLATALAALGVVYGDIGTSPLYALKECFAPEYGLAPTAPNVLGVLSLIFWSLNFVVSLKYLTFIMQADNRGEGGILALLALLHPAASNGAGARRLLVGARAVRRGAALRRRRDHSGHLGAGRRRGRQRGGARPSDLGRPDSLES